MSLCGGGSCFHISNESTLLWSTFLLRRRRRWERQFSLPSTRRGQRGTFANDDDQTREMACRLLHIGSQKIRISSLPVVFRGESNTNTQLVFLSLYCSMTVSSSSSSCFWGRMGPESGIIWSGNGHGSSRRSPPPPHYVILSFFRLYRHSRSVSYCSTQIDNDDETFSSLCSFFFPRCASTSINIGASTWHPLNGFFLLYAVFLYQLTMSSNPVIYLIDKKRGIIVSTTGHLICTITT